MLNEHDSYCHKSAFAQQLFLFFFWGRIAQNIAVGSHFGDSLRLSAGHAGVSVCLREPLVAHGSALAFWPMCARAISRKMTSATWGTIALPSEWRRSSFLGREALGDGWALATLELAAIKVRADGPGDGAVVAAEAPADLGEGHAGAMGV